MCYNASEFDPAKKIDDALTDFNTFLSKQPRRVSLVCHPKNHGYALMDALMCYKPDLKASFLTYVSCFVDVFDLLPTAGEKAKTLESLYEQNVGRLQFSLQESQGRAAALYEIFQTSDVDPGNETYSFTVDYVLTQASWRPLLAMNVVTKAEAHEAAKMGKNPYDLRQSIQRADLPESETGFRTFRRSLENGSWP